jgi:hypothetical protein
MEIGNFSTSEFAARKPLRNKPIAPPRSLTVDRLEQSILEPGCHCIFYRRIGRQTLPPIRYSGCAAAPFDSAQLPMTRRCVSPLCAAVGRTAELVYNAPFQDKDQRKDI